MKPISIPRAEWPSAVVSSDGVTGNMRYCRSRKPLPAMFDRTMFDRDGVDSQPLPASLLSLARFMLDVKQEK